VDEPAFDLEKAIHGLLVDLPALSEEQPRPRRRYLEVEKHWIHSRIRSARRGLTGHWRWDVASPFVGSAGL